MTGKWQNWGKPAKKKKEKEKPANRQRETAIAGGLIAALFVGLLCYFIYFEAAGKEEIITNPLNNRTANMAQLVRKGDIVTSDDVVVATTQNAADGTEYRLYPFSSLFAHTIGYPVLGGMGLESTQKINLLTTHTPLLEQLQKEFLGEKSQGDRLITTLDYRISVFCNEQLSGRNGAIIVMEPKTGKVRAMVASPGFDPNTIEADWSWIISADNTSANLVNRATQGQYPPGSTFKLITLLEYIRENPDTWQDFHYSCDGVYTNGTLIVGCHGGVAHGELDIYGALAQSCNGAFDTMGLTLDKDKWQALAEAFGYNSPLSLEIAAGRSSFDIAGDDSTWNRMQLSVGQGSTVVTPLTNLLTYCAAANGGTVMKPLFSERLESAEGAVVRQYTPEVLRTACSPSEAALLNDFLTRVITQGTAGAAASPYAQVAGKTGSAQYSSAAGQYHAWFCGYAPADDPEIAVCVLIERGGTGGEVAAPIAGNIFNYWFSR